MSKISKKDNSADNKKVISVIRIGRRGLEVVEGLSTSHEDADESACCLTKCIFQRNTPQCQSLEGPVELPANLKLNQCRFTISVSNFE